MGKKHRVILEKGDMIDFISAETGECVTKNRSDIIPEIRKDALLVVSRNMLETQRGDRFIRTFNEGIKELSEKCRADELGLLYKLMFYMSMDSQGRLMRAGKPMRIRDITVIADRKESATKALMAKLIKAGAISTTGSTRNKVYHISSFVAAYGTSDSEDYFIKLFIKSNREVVSTLNIVDLGFLFKLLPYFNWKHGWLCRNGEDENSERLTTIEDVMEITNEKSRMGVANKLHRLMSYGILVQDTLASGTIVDKTIYINFCLVSRKNQEYNTSIPIISVSIRATREAIARGRSRGRG